MPAHFYFSLRSSDSQYTISSIFYGASTSDRSLDPVPVIKMLVDCDLLNRDDANPSDTPADSAALFSAGKQDVGAEKDPERIVGDKRDFYEYAD
jgi:hypothetical protein